ncbi:MAG TPA: leucyl aminopeptidase [Xanthomonadales bacterium]|nr:leucyl aminopeptidase [Xanthomonadales bacterium]
MHLNLSETTALQSKAACVVIGVCADGPLGASAKAIDRASDGALQALLDSGDIATANGKTTMFHHFKGISSPRLLVVGLGDSSKLDEPRYDQACFNAGRLLRDHPVEDCHVCLHENKVGKKSAGWRVRQAALAIMRANYRYTATKKPADKANKPLAKASFLGKAALKPALDQAFAMAQGYELARHLSDLPPNICNPDFMAAEAGRLAEGNSKVELEILERPQMTELGMGALLGVACGSSTDPKLIVLKYKGSKASDRPVVLVGKGITFDSGGLSLKSPDNMTEMKYDMCGAASVLGAFKSCLALKLKINVICVVAAVENMPGGNAYRPGDVVTSMSGKTIEVLNTDAEGRLVLCDALTYSERFEPRCIIDVATLTGACVVALGHPASGLLSNDDKLANQLLQCGEDVVDRAWRMPLWNDYQPQIDSEFADMKNVGGMSAGTITAACFLSRYTENQSWAHLDVAGTAWKWKGNEGATGRPAGMLTRFLMQQAGIKAV